MAWTNRNSLMELISDYWNNKQRANLLCSDAFSYWSIGGFELGRQSLVTGAPRATKGTCCCRKRPRSDTLFTLVIVIAQRPGLK